jgi:hypothetical protein
MSLTCALSVLSCGYPCQEDRAVDGCRFKGSFAIALIV